MKICMDTSAVTLEPKSHPAPRGLTDQVSISSGSLHIKSQKGPSCGISQFLSIVLICSMLTRQYNKKIPEVKIFQRYDLQIFYSNHIDQNKEQIPDQLCEHQGTTHHAHKEPNISPKYILISKLRSKKS
jgi:hypothetical protein